MIRRAALLALVLAPVLAHAQAQSADIAWMKDEKAAFAKAKAQNQLIMVDVFSVGDQYSRRFDEGTLKDPEVVELSKKLIALKSDPSKDGRALAVKYAVNGFPTMLFLGPDGHVVSKLVGYETGSDFVDVIKVALDSFKEFDAVKAEATKNPRDGEANAKYAAFLSAQTDPTTGQPPVGAPFLEHALSSNYRGPYLLLALEAVGDGYATIRGKEPIAISYYQKALTLSKTPAQKAKAMIGVMYLQMDSNKPAAETLAQKIIDLKDAPPEWVYAAKEALADLKKG